MNEPDWQGKPQHPLRDALKMLMGGLEPPDYVQGYDYVGFTDDQHSRLQEWVGMNMPTSIYWSTAIGIIDAAEKIVDEAVDNANIPPKDSEWRMSGRRCDLAEYTSHVALLQNLSELWEVLKLAMEQTGFIQGIRYRGVLDNNKSVKAARIPKALVAGLILQSHSIQIDLTKLKKKLFDA